MLLKNLNKDNFKLCAIRAYTNPYCMTEDEFNSDLYKISKIKYYLSLYSSDKEINIRSLVNHFVILFNNFKAFPIINMLFFSVLEKHHSQLKTILHFMNMLPLSIDVVDIRKIPLDKKLLHILEKEI